MYTKYITKCISPRTYILHVYMYIHVMYSYCAYYVCVHVCSTFLLVSMHMIFLKGKIQRLTRKSTGDKTWDVFEAHKHIGI